MTDLDDELEDDLTCPECDGSGRDPSYDEAEAEDLYGPRETRHPTAPNGDCPVCCGFGHMDW